MAQTADILIINARALTMDPAAPTATTIAVAGNRILAAGDFDPAAFRGPATEIIDAGGKTVLPGLIDSHVHLFGGSGELDCLNLAEIEGEAALTAAVRAESQRKPHDPQHYAVCANTASLAPSRVLTGTCWTGSCRSVRLR